MEPKIGPLLIAFYICLALVTIQTTARGIKGSARVEWKVVDFKSIVTWKRIKCAPNFTNYELQSCLSNCTRRSSEWIARTCHSLGDVRNKKYSCRAELPVGYLGSKLRICLKKNDESPSKCKRKGKKNCWSTFKTYDTIKERSIFSKPNMTLSQVSSHDAYVTIEEPSGLFFCYMDNLIEYTLYWAEIPDQSIVSVCKITPPTESMKRKARSAKAIIRKSDIANPCPGYHAPTTILLSGLESNKSYCVFGNYEAENLENNNGPSEFNYHRVTTKPGLPINLLPKILAGSIGVVLAIVLVTMTSYFIRRWIDKAKDIPEEDKARVGSCLNVDPSLLQLYDDVEEPPETFDVFYPNPNIGSSTAATTNGENAIEGSQVVVERREEISSSSSDGRGRMPAYILRDEQRKEGSHSFQAYIARHQRNSCEAASSLEESYSREISLPNSVDANFASSFNTSHDQVWTDSSCSSPSAPEGAYSPKSPFSAVLNFHQKWGKEPSDKRFTRFAEGTNDEGTELKRGLPAPSTEDDVSRYLKLHVPSPENGSDIVRSSKSTDCGGNKDGTRTTSGFHDENSPFTLSRKNRHNSPWRDCCSIPTFDVLKNHGSIMESPTVLSSLINVSSGNYQSKTNFSIERKKLLHTSNEEIDNYGYKNNEDELV